jgi:hypothetical protein
MGEQFDLPTDKKSYPDRFGSSVIGKLFSIEFELELYVKHEGWAEFGKGKMVSVPIRIH